MKLHLVDGTYELFRSFYGAPPKKAPDGREVGATLGLVRSMMLLLSSPGVTHVGVAFDHVVESFRNRLYPGYKTGEGIDPALMNQFPLAEQAVAALGIAVWPMVEFEADDALGSATERWRDDKDVKQVVICSPDKDLAQLVSGKRVVCWDRRRELIIDQSAVVAKYGVPPASIPDWLALVGDAADGYPGIKGWGEKSASAVLHKFKHLEAIPAESAKWRLPSISAGRAVSLAGSLASRAEEARLYKRLATLRLDVPLKERLADLEWKGAKKRLKELCREWGDQRIPDRVKKWL
jgi:5'-3' exonuclease